MGMTETQYRKGLLHSVSGGCEPQPLCAAEWDAVLREQGMQCFLQVLNTTRDCSAGEGSDLAT